MTDTLDLLTAARKLAAAADGDDEAMLSAHESRVVHDLLRPVVDATVEHSRAVGAQAPVLRTNERTLALAVAIIEVMRERYELPDREMDYVLSVALMVWFKAEAGDREAWRIINEGLGKLVGTVSQIDAARAGKTIN